ncbi:hypothetical protein CQR52_0522 [Bifidobacterium pseudolongum subsp. pseudolongum]|nr:hypothetical protein CQR52_0522 [Bifidobacterium pseudolongum subsp. pseudolongum]
MAKRNEPTKEQVEAAAGFLRDNLHLFGPQACFLRDRAHRRDRLRHAPRGGKGRALSRADVTAMPSALAQAAGVKLAISAESAFGGGRHQEEETA